MTEERNDVHYIFYTECDHIAVCVGKAPDTRHKGKCYACQNSYPVETQLDRIERKIEALR